MPGVRARPSLLDAVEGGLAAFGGPDVLVLSSPVPLTVDHPYASGQVHLRRSESAGFALHHGRRVETGSARVWRQPEIGARLDDTVAAWEGPVGRMPLWAQPAVGLVLLAGEGGESSVPKLTLGAIASRTKYDLVMAGVQEYLVSSSGQLSLPAAARHRWNLDRGGPVDVIDLGFAVMALPQGQARRLLNDLLSRDEHAEYVASLAEDPDLATM